jgi:hypothetical protein
MAGTAREEAERLVATVLAMAGRSALGGGGVSGAWATGSAECCVCPVCRVISSLRDPQPMTVERLATGAGDFATGLASLMRAVSTMAGNARPPHPERRAARPPHPEGPAAPPSNPDTTWSAATRTTDSNRRPAEPSAPDVWAAATGDHGAAEAGRTTDADRKPAERSAADVWAAATADHGAAEAGTVDHDGTEA